MDVGVHLIDLLRWLIGQEVVEVRGAVDTRGYPFPIDWNAGAVLRFQGGALAVVQVSFDNRFRENYLAIGGSRGSLRAEGSLWRRSSGSVRALTERGGFEYRSPEGGPDPYVLQIQHFADCLRAGRPPLIDGGEGLRDLQACLAVYESAHSGAAVRLEP
jgi:predicted dehydrogenase